jgi:ribosomal protein RSM22 (predicted rRNA methylase)
MYIMTPRTFHLPAKYEARISTFLDKCGLGLNKSAELAEAVQRLSNFYVGKDDGQDSGLFTSKATPWHEKWVALASAVYYFPLNYVRAQAVAQELKRVGFLSGITHLFDMGAGHGSATYAFADEFTELEILQVEVAEEALQLGRELAAEPKRVMTSTCVDLKESHEVLKPFDMKHSVILASYVFTELDAWPEEWLEAEALVIIEPSMREKSRRLLELRQSLIDRGYHVWAPCTHQGACPLLTQSKRDWCHDRVHFEAPAWFKALEEHLPMRNRTLTFSYLAARRTGPPHILRGLARLTGDTLVEKGKTRQSICRSPSKEFLSWFPQRMNGEGDFELERGILVELKDDLPIKADEIRISSQSDIVIVGNKL